MPCLGCVGQSNEGARCGGDGVGCGRSLCCYDVRRSGGPLGLLDTWLLIISTDMSAGGELVD